MRKTSLIAVTVFLPCLVFAYSKNKLDDRVMALAASGAKSSGLGLRYSIDEAALGDVSALSDEGADQLINTVSAVEYALRLLSRDAKTRSKIEKLDEVVVVPGKATATRDEWAKAEDAERAVKKLAKPNEPGLDDRASLAKYDHFLKFKIAGKKLRVECQFSMCTQATQHMKIREVLTSLLK